jgi:hypothetical protein
MTLIAYLLTQNWEWQGAQIRLLRVIDDEAGHAPGLEALQNLIAAARVEASVEVIISTAPFAEIFQQQSRDATSVIMGFETPAEGGENECTSELTRFLTVCRQRYWYPRPARQGYSPEISRRVFF